MTREQAQNELSEIPGLLMETCPKCGQEIIFGQLNGGVCSDCVHMELMAETEERIYQLRTVSVLDEQDEIGLTSFKTLALISASCDLEEYLMDQKGMLILDEERRGEADWERTRDRGHPLSSTSLEVRRSTLAQMLWRDC
ncbi:hypothetical protein [Ruegeria sp. HKCCD8929]|uniref:hypothetical protein n=1 Tax=Ruegeria sp. HKCCD8929 TaxID=2683006 RepID=UPI00148A009C|nr:hypothetical protein [Ruegeria sp. HKCCD8929]